MSTDSERVASAFAGALAALIMFFCLSSIAVALSNRYGHIRALTVEAPDFVSVSKPRRGSEYTVDTTSNTCYVMFTNAMGISFAPVECAAIGVDPYSLPRTGQ